MISISTIEWLPDCVGLNVMDKINFRSLDAILLVYSTSGLFFNRAKPAHFPHVQISTCLQALNYLSICVLFSSLSLTLKSL